MTRGEMLDEVVSRIKTMHKDGLDEPVVHYRQMQTVMMQFQAEFEELLPQLNGEPVRVVLEVRPAAEPHPVMVQKRNDLRRRLADRWMKKTT